MATPKGLVPVTQADRDAAAERIAIWGDVHAAMEAHAVRTGEQDEHGLVQAFARHRADALTEALQVVREAREEIAELLDGYREHSAFAVAERLTAFIAQHEGEAE